MSAKDMRKLMESVKPIISEDVVQGPWGSTSPSDHQSNLSRMDEFCSAYIEAALWSSTGSPVTAKTDTIKYADAVNDQTGRSQRGQNDEPDDEPLDRNFSIHDISADTLRQMKADCDSFQEKAGELIDNDSQAGHDFWLTRNGHGAGFWDGDWPEPAATELTNLSKQFGEFDLYIGDDGMVHGMGSSMNERAEKVSQTAARKALAGKSKTHSDVHRGLGGRVTPIPTGFAGTSPDPKIGGKYSPGKEWLALMGQPSTVTFYRKIDDIDGKEVWDVTAGAQMVERGLSKSAAWSYYQKGMRNQHENANGTLLVVDEIDGYVKRIASDSPNMDDSIRDGSFDIKDDKGGDNPNEPFGFRESIDELEKQFEALIK